MRVLRKHAQLKPHVCFPSQMDEDMTRSQSILGPKLGLPPCLLHGLWSQKLPISLSKCNVKQKCEKSGGDHCEIVWSIWQLVTNNEMSRFLTRLNKLIRQIWNLVEIRYAGENGAGRIHTCSRCQIQQNICHLRKIFVLRYSFYKQKIPTCKNKDIVFLFFCHVPLPLSG